MKFSGWDYLDHMLMACEELSVCMEGIKSAEELKASIVNRRAVVMCLLDLGELLKKVEANELGEYPTEHWHRIIGFRNRSAHGYQDLDFGLVYSIAVNRVPPLYEFLKNKMQEQKSDDV